MRTIREIINDYMNWIADQKNDDSIRPNAFFKDMTEDEENIYRSQILKELNNKFYDKDCGSFYFCVFALGDLRYAPGVVRRPWRQNNLMLRWDALMKKYRFLAIMCSRTLGKTSKISVSESIRRTYLFRNYRVLVESASVDIVTTEVIEKIKSIIDTNELLLLKKTRNAVWQKERLTYNGGSIIGKGYGSAVRGIHVDAIFVDDILRKDNKLSNNAIKDFFFRELTPMVKDSRGQLILVGTPMNEDDLFADISERAKNEQSDWHFSKFPAITSYERKEVQCPDRYTFEELMKERLNIGEWRFEVEYQVMFRPPSKGIFSDTVLNVAYDKGHGHVFKSRGEKEVLYFIGVDVARGGTASADYTQFTVIHIDEETKERYIDRIERYKGLKISKQVIRLVDLAKRFNYATIMVERNNIGQDMVDQLIDNYGIPVETYLTSATGAGNKKEDLVRYTVQCFENELMVLPNGAEDEMASPGFSERDIMLQLRNELESFSIVQTPAGNETFRGVGSKDDSVMSLCLAVMATKKLSFDGGVFAVDDFDFERSKESDIVKMIEMGIIR